jgi:DNA polymerase I-like protein with 3'-5' exonuclease and polymerase domains
MRLACDIETNGFLEQGSIIHVLVAVDIDTGMEYVFNRNTMQEGVLLLQKAEALIFHNGLKFDIPFIQKVFPDSKFDTQLIIDTLVMSRVMFTNLYDTDPSLIRRGILNPRNIGRHSLEAWGERLGDKKDSYEGGWEEWNKEMESYCKQDVKTLVTLYKFFLTKNYSTQCLTLEHQVATILARQERRGVTFDVKAASSLYAELSKERMIIERQLRDTFPPFYLKDGRESFIPKKTSVKLGYTEGSAVTKVKLTEFNPGSRDHISLRLRTIRGWKPTEFTNDGKPKVDDLVLSKLPYPEAKLLAKYMMLNKRIGQVAEGDQAWLKLQKDGVIYGGVNTNGAVTGRMTHMTPNLAQVPAVYSPYGKECRSLFKPRKGYVLVGADASALELRCLAGYMFPFDNGSYIDVVTKGKKEDGTEIHTVNMKALGITDRDVAKTWIYAYLYGAGDEKLGTVFGHPKGAKAVKEGKLSRAKFLTAIPAMKELISRVKAKAETTGILKGLDGRLLHVRSSHSALNTLLQSAGAIIMKQALVCLDSSLKDKFSYGTDYAFLLNIHDEWQLEVKPEIAEEVGKLCLKALQDAGKLLKFACEITGEYRIGNSWYETH